ncbi:MAG: photosystem II reaction center protein Ycf12/Psb30 [Actinomycetota bacterium]
MDFLTDVFNGLTSFNYEAIVQLVLVAAIMISGPVVIFLLAARGGDL